MGNDMHLRLGENAGHLQLRGKQSAHFGHVVFITADSVFHLFISVLAFARTVRRRRRVRHGRGQGWRPGLICNVGFLKKEHTNPVVRCSKIFNIAACSHVFLILYRDHVKCKGIYSNSIWSLKGLLIDQLVSKYSIKRQL